MNNAKNSTIMEGQAEGPKSFRFKGCSIMAVLLFLVFLFYVTAINPAPIYFNLDRLTALSALAAQQDGRELSETELREILQAAPTALGITRYKVTLRYTDSQHWSVTFTPEKSEVTCGLLVRIRFPAISFGNPSSLKLDHLYEGVEP